MDIHTAMLTFLEGEFNREQASDFALLRRIPSTYVWQFLDYFSTLMPTDQAALATTFAYRALSYFFPPAQIVMCSPDPGAYPRYWRKLAAMRGNGKYLGTRSLRALLSERNDRPAPANLLQQARAIRPVTASDLRHQVNTSFAQTFTATATNLGAGTWRYLGIYHDVEIAVVIDYHNRLAQLRYWVVVHAAHRGIRLGPFSYEALMGFPEAHWDGLEQGNLQPSIACLQQLVIYCAELPQRLPPAYLQSWRD